MIISFNQAVESIRLTHFGDEDGRIQARVSAALLQSIDTMSDTMALVVKTGRLTVAQNNTIALPPGFSSLMKIGVIIDNDRIVQLVSDSDIRIINDGGCSCQKSSDGTISVNEGCTFHAFLNFDGRPIYGYRKYSNMAYRVNMEDRRIEFASQIQPGQEIYIEYKGSFDTADDVFIPAKYVEYFGYKVQQIIYSSQDPGKSAYAKSLAEQTFRTLKAAKMDYDYYELIGALDNQHYSAPKYL